MKHTLILLSLLISFGTANAQFTVKKILKPSDGECNGKIVLEFEESELPATLSVVSQSTGGVSNVETKTYTLSNLCADSYTITMTDNHECVTTDEVVLEECEIEATYTVTRVDCNKFNGYKIELEDLSEGNLFFKWSRNNQPLGYETSSVSNISHGNYNVVISDEYNCSQSIDIIIEDTDVAISDITQPIFDGDGCDGKVSLKANSPNIEYTITLKVNFEIVYTIVKSLYGDIFEIPIDLCYYDDNLLVVSDPYGCVKEFPINLTYSDCESFDLKVDELWHASNEAGEDWDNGIVKVKLTDPNLDPNDFKFSLYKVIFGVSIPIESGIGKTEFHNLDANCQQYDWDECDYITDEKKEEWQNDLSYWYCDYKISVEQINGSNCKKSTNFKVRQCSNSIPFGVHAIYNIPKYLDAEGKVQVMWRIKNNVLDYRYDNFTYKVTGPSGEIYNHINYSAPFNGSVKWHNGIYYGLLTYWPQKEGQPEHCYYASDDNYLHFYVFEPGEYCLQVDDGCGNIEEDCTTIFNCDESLNLKSNSYLVYPSQRDKGELGEGYENIEKAFLSSTSNACFIYENADGQECQTFDKYLDNSNVCNVDKKYFTYTPNEENNPCDGGVVTMYDIKNIYGKYKVFYNTTFEINEPADFEFKWSNGYNPLVTGSVQQYRYSHISADINFSKDLCKKGQYCLFESSRIFSDLASEKYFLFSTCKEIVDVCDLYPNSWECGQGTCDDNIQNGNETGIDCGGSCPPCDDPGSGNDDCFFPCVEGVEDCVNGECLIICNVNTPCIETGFECVGGYCIEVEGECSTGEDCPDGFICTEGFCVEYTGQGGCDSPCEILDNFPSPGLQNTHVTVEICIDFGGFPELSAYENEDLTGELFYSEIYDYLEPGAHELIIPAGELPLGKCYLVVENDGYISNVEPQFINLFHDNEDDIDTRENNNTMFGSDIEIPFLVYPNPNTGKFTIENISGELIEELQIYDIGGRKINLSIQDKGRIIEIDLNDVVNGVYFLAIQTQSISNYHKIIVK